MDRDTFSAEVQDARKRGDTERLDELNRMAARGEVGASTSETDRQSAFEKEVERARRNGDTERLQELNRMAAEGRTDEVGASPESDGMEQEIRLELARAEGAGDTKFANQLQSILDAPNPAEALESAIEAARRHNATDRLDRLTSITD